METKKFKLWTLVLLGINSIIGSGIFMYPAYVYKQIGEGSSLMFIFVAFLVSTIALCFAECASNCSENGAAYAYAKDAFGNFTGFIVGFMRYVVALSAWPALIVGFTMTLGAVVPVMASPMAQKISIVVLVSGFTLLNISGLKNIEKFNNISTIAKLVPLVLFIAIGFFFVDKGSVIPSFSPEMGSTVVFSNAAIMVLYAFTGFEALATSVKDVENPKVDIPKALIIIMTIVSLFYVFITAITIGIMGSELTSDPAMMKAPLAFAFKRVIGDVGFYIITGGTLISLFAIVFAGSYFAPRILSSLAETHMIPEVFGKKNEKGMPYIAILVTGGLAIIIGLSGSYLYLTQLSVVARFLQYIPTILAVFVYRRRNTNIDGYKMPFGYTIPIIALVLSTFLLYNSAKTDPTKIMIGAVGVIVAALVYLLYTKKRIANLELSTN